MSSLNAADKRLLNISKKHFHELEDKIFEKLALDYRFKEILQPFAILDIDEKRVLLGSTKEIVGKVNYNASLGISLRELVGFIVGDGHIKMEVKTSENEFQAVKKRINKKMFEQMEQEKILATVEAQKIEGKCNLLPFPAQENKVRSDLSIERHAIFAANTFKENLRIFERTIRNHKTGEKFLLTIEVGSRTGQVKGVLKQKHQEIFYKLSQAWAQQEYLLDEDRGFSVGILELTAYELVNIIRTNDSGRNYKASLQLLDEMASIRVNIMKESLETGIVEVQNFSLLSYEWRVKNLCKKTLLPKPGGNSKVKIRFSDFITNNFLKKNVKTLMMSPYLSLKDKGKKGVAQLLYAMLDYELYSKEKYNISLSSLADRLGITKYKFKSKRREKLESSISSVNGALILDGQYKINTYLVDSAGKKDWILVARREQLQSMI